MLLTLSQNRNPRMMIFHQPVFTFRANGTKGAGWGICPPLPHFFFARLESKSQDFESIIPSPIFRPSTGSDNDKGDFK